MVFSHMVCSFCPDSINHFLICSSTICEEKFRLRLCSKLIATLDQTKFKVDWVPGLFHLYMGEVFGISDVLCNWSLRQRINDCLE